MIPVVISDIHSRQNKLIEVLQRAGVLDMMNNRIPGYQLIQVGDAVSAGYGMKEAEFYRFWVSLLEPQDIELAGNHEAPILIPSAKSKFYGFDPGDMGTDGCDPELKVEVLARQKNYRVAHVVNDWLITHAGVHRRWKRENAHDTASDLNKRWDEHFNASCNLHIMNCAICCPHYGVLWVRDLEKSALDPTKIKQIFGHTPDGPTLSKGGTMWNIDTPRLTPPDTMASGRSEAEAWGGVSALKWNASKNDWELFYVQ